MQLILKCVVCKDWTLSHRIEPLCLDVVHWFKGTVIGCCSKHTQQEFMESYDEYKCGDPTD
jgi:hypothetical protein